MAILHRTWTFDPGTAHGEISARVIEGNAVNSRALVELTRETADHADAATAHYLEMVRYDPEWLDEDDLDEAHLYVACLGPYLAPARNCDNPLLLVLFLHDRRNWDNHETSRVLNGDALSTLPITDPLMQSVRPRLTLQFGGWMSKEVAAEVCARLRAEEKRVYEPTRGDIRWLTKKLWSQADAARQILVNAYESAINALTTLEDEPQGTALRCIAD